MRVLLIVIALATAGSTASAQTLPESPPPSPEAPATQTQGQDAGEGRDAPDVSDLAFVPAEPDFTLIALPSTLRLPGGKWGFRVSHRFTRSLGEGSFGDLAADFFGFDSGSLVGLELRYGVRPGTQLVLLRTSDRTMQLLAQQSLLAPRGDQMFAVDALAAVQGLDNFSESYTTTLGVLLSRRFGDRGAVYAEPLVVLNALPEADDSDATVMVALGTRIRFGASTYIVAEFAPRLSGATPGDHHGSVAIEKRRGGHSFQINFSNSFATTLGQIARAYGGSGSWHIGFNISRKFYRGR